MISMKPGEDNAARREVKQIKPMVPVSNAVEFAIVKFARPAVQQYLKE